MRLLILIGGLLALLAGGAFASTPTITCSVCPDLWVDESRLLEPSDFGTPTFTVETFAPDSCPVLEGMVGAGERNLLNFTTATINRGKGPMHIGDPADWPSLFEFDECHGHLHFIDYMAYRLWTPSEFAAWQAIRGDRANNALSSVELLAANPSLQPVTGRKQGFCLEDFEQYAGKNPKNEKRWSGETYDCFYQGLSPTWADTYPSGCCQGQWIDVTGLSGTFVLENEVNANRVVEETSYRNNLASVEVTIP